MVRKATEADIPAVTAIYDALLDREEQGLLSTGWARGCRCGNGRGTALSRVYATPRCPYWRCSGIRSVCAPARTARRCSDGYAAAWKRPPAVDNRGQKSL